jgi:hypothetical protein
LTGRTGGLFRFKLPKKDVKEMIGDMSNESLEIEINVDGKVMPMNKFVQEIFGNIFVGMLNSLRETENWKKVTLTLER